MPYCNKCGRYIAGSETGGLCEDCKDKGRFYMPGTLPSHMMKKEYSLRDGAITFVIIFALIMGLAFLFSWILGR